MKPHRPAWFADGWVITSNAPTCGINKDGAEQYAVDALSGQRLAAIDDRLFDDARRLASGDASGGTLARVPLAEVQRAKVLCPQYYDHTATRALERFVAQTPGFRAASLDELRASGVLELRRGHGSPSSDQRLGDVPYIKVSDLRAGHVNINASNLVPLALAREFWGGDSSGLKPYDLISPQRASKNIGDFCVLMPGQEQVVLTKEVMIARPGPAAQFDPFYLLWAFTLKVVREQWKRVVLMQTNREDVGDRAFEIRLPVPDSAARAAAVSEPFRAYFRALEHAREGLAAAIARSGHKHHWY